MSRRRYWKACARAYSYLFNGIDITSADHWLNEATASIVVDRMIAQRHLLAHLGIAPAKYAAFNLDRNGTIKPMKRPERPVREVADLLVRLGLRIKGKQSRNVHTTGDISIVKMGLVCTNEPQHNAPKRGRVYQVTAESLSTMHSWTSRRDLVRRPEPAPTAKPAPEAAKNGAQTARPPFFYILPSVPDPSLGSGSAVALAAAKV